MIIYYGGFIYRLLMDGPSVKPFPPEKEPKYRLLRDRYRELGAPLPQFWEDKDE